MTDHRFCIHRIQAAVLVCDEQKIQRYIDFFDPNDLLIPRIVSKYRSFINQSSRQTDLVLLWQRDSYSSIPFTIIQFSVFPMYKK